MQLSTTHGEHLPLNVILSQSQEASPRSCKLSSIYKRRTVNAVVNGSK